MFKFLKYASFFSTVALMASEPEEVYDDSIYRVKDNELIQYIKNNKSNGLHIKLYQYQVCPFCCKTRTFLKYSKIPFEIVEVEPMLKGELAWSKYKKVPVVTVNSDIQLNDSSYIISCLNQGMNDLSYQTPEMFESEVKWRYWVDHKLVHTIPPNIYRNHQEAVEAFEYISAQNQYTWYQKAAVKYLGSVAMQVVAERLKKRHKIENEREALFECGDEWMKEVGAREFHGGTRPDLADLAVFGALSSIEGLRAFHDLLKHNPQVGKWYDTVRNQIE
jgi:microsomal prostaglandin-E synthase 2